MLARTRRTIGTSYTKLKKAFAIWAYTLVHAVILLSIFLNSGSVSPITGKAELFLENIK